MARAGPLLVLCEEKIREKSGLALHRDLGARRPAGGRGTPAEGATFPPEGWAGGAGTRTSGSRTVAGPGTGGGARSGRGGVGAGLGGGRGRGRAGRSRGARSRPGLLSGARKRFFALTSKITWFPFIS